MMSLRIVAVCVITCVVMSSHAKNTKRTVDDLSNLFTDFTAPLTRRQETPLPEGCTMVKSLCFVAFKAVQDESLTLYNSPIDQFLSDIMDDLNKAMAKLGVCFKLDAVSMPPYLYDIGENSNTYELGASNIVIWKESGLWPAATEAGCDFGLILLDTQDTIAQAQNKVGVSVYLEPCKNAFGEVVLLTGTNQFINLIAHEIAHMLGCKHDQEVYTEMAPYAGAYNTYCPKEWGQIEAVCKTQSDDTVQIMSAWVPGGESDFSDCSKVQTDMFKCLHHFVTFFNYTCVDEESVSKRAMRMSYHRSMDDALALERAVVEYVSSGRNADAFEDKIASSPDVVGNDAILSTLEQALDEMKEHAKGQQKRHHKDTQSTLSSFIDILLGKGDTDGSPADVLATWEEHKEDEMGTSIARQTQAKRRRERQQAAKSKRKVR